MLTDYSRPKVVVTHEPTGLSAYCSEHRSPRKNKEVAIGLLKSRLCAAQQLSINPDDITWIVVR